MSRLAVLRVLLFACLVGGAVWLLSRVSWEARLTIEDPGRQTNWTVRLGRGPVWDPPPAPPRQRFEETFPDLPAAGGEIDRAVWWDEVFIEAAFGLWLIVAGFAVPYLLIRENQRDPVFHVCARLAWAVSAWGGVSVALWFLVGGWGPPCLSCFILLGFGHGVIAGLVSFADSSAAEKPPPVPAGEETDSRVG
jgi:hypothetical protein